MASADRLVRYRCTSKSCNPKDREDRLDALERRGCEDCGCKRLEIWDMGVQGHLIADWRSKKSLRKKARRVA